jgi:hypothetical protein
METVNYSRNKFYDTGPSIRTQYKVPHLSALKLAQIVVILSAVFLCFFIKLCRGAECCDVHINRTVHIRHQ